MKDRLCSLRGQCRRLDRFISEQSDLMNSPVIQQFIQQEEHRQALADAFCKNTAAAKANLDDIFRAFYGDMQFTSYVLKTLQWSAIHFDKQLRKQNQVEQLLIDSHPKDAEIPEWPDLKVPLTEDAASDQKERLADMIENKLLYHGLCQLTPRQHYVLYEKYKNDLSDLAIAEQLGVSQQAVFKSRKTALERLSQIMGKDDVRL
ncbi:hypothetical protein [Alteribacillus sp. HJP-4]|uniref:hypothetical protein n=1 Tax=Alteribacillus sp. HJP-4 TaxID=2775394 RepID=UPI0035CD35EF